MVDSYSIDFPVVAHIVRPDNILQCKMFRGELCSPLQNTLRHTTPLYSISHPILI